MKDTPWGIVQVLTKDNYDRWKNQMKIYLMMQKLWTVVQTESDSVSTNVGAGSSNEIDNNELALCIIQSACGSKILDEISHLNTAKEAWNFLAWRYGSELEATPDIEQGRVGDNVRHCIKLYKCVEEGDEKGVELFLSLAEGRRALFLTSDSDRRTVLHVAAIAGHVKVVEVLVREGEDILLKMHDNMGNTALALAAYLTGKTEVAECMVEDKKGGRIRQNLLAIANNDGEIPLLLAADRGHKRMTRYLFSKTPYKVLNEQDYDKRVLLLERCIREEILDVALGLLELYLELDQLPPESLPDVFLALRALAKMPYAFLSGCQFGFLHNFIYNFLRVEETFEISHEANFSGFRFCSPIKNVLLLPVMFLGIRKIYEQKRTHRVVQQILSYMQILVKKLNNSQLQRAFVYDAMLDAAKHGIVEFIESMAKADHDLLWSTDNYKRGIFSYAILHRKQIVFQLIYNLNGRKDIIKYRIDVFGNNLLHLAAHLGPSSDVNDRAGAALQMQREFQWFKAVEEVVSLKCKEARNDDGKKPRELFTETHKELVKEGEKWAKQAAKSFALVGILITTVMFAAAFTVPDAISLFTSATSVLIFIWILTSRFAEKDFLKRIPFKLLAGLGFLFLSVASMMVAFCAALGVVLNHYWAYKRLFIGGAILGSIPVFVLVPSQLRLIYEILLYTLSNPIRRGSN
ncbi:uncharacterized protein LOC109799869 isoform X2 [Cajanus cajan]|uniref:uncharacterized protein LOC109799869 isoform X2 n=1 Tax=Cajanus cajan TaxID=3821 RepID=UPI00098D8CA5|nr:uncharacterized protein LOC109799869 isoform X2 [Cajanus cajan]